MKKRLFLLMLMLLTGAQTVLHCADVEDRQEKVLLFQDLKLEGSEINLDEIDEIEASWIDWGFNYPLGFLGAACGFVSPLVVGERLLSSEIYVRYLRESVSRSNRDAFEQIRKEVLEAPIEAGIEAKKAFAKWMVEKAFEREFKSAWELHYVPFCSAALICGV